MKISELLNYDLLESATAGSTSASGATVANPSIANSKKPVKSVNALDQNEVSLFGAPMEDIKTKTIKSAIIKRR